MRLFRQNIGLLKVAWSLSLRANSCLFFNTRLISTCSPAASINMTTSLQQKITEQGTKIRELKASGADKDLIATQVQLLLELKKQAAGSTNEPTTGKGKKFILKTPKVADFYIKIGGFIVWYY